MMGEIRPPAGGTMTDHHTHHRTSRISSLARRLVLVAGVGYAAAVLVLELLWAFAEQLHWAIGFSSIFGAWFFAPVAVLVPAAALLRSRWLAGASAALLILFLALFGARLLPHTGLAANPNLRVITINQRFVNSGEDAVLAAIAAQDADVVAIQELTPGLAELLSARLSAEYPHQLLDPSDGAGGMGLLSRFPIEDQGWFAGTRAQHVALRLESQTVDLYNVHLHFSGISRARSERFWSLPYYRLYETDGRIDQVRSLAEAARDSAGPVIMLGDFNTGDREEGYEILAAELRDAFAESGWGMGFTFPNQRQMGPVTIPIPLVRIDYVWTRGGVAPVATRVNCAVEGADHCMIIADLAVQ